MSIDDLKVNPLIGPRKQLYARATFPCPHCGETVEMKFTGEDLRTLLEGYNEGLRRGQK